MKTTFGRSGVKPDFVGVGEQRCATTWLSECLRFHPEIFLSTPKEIHYFSAYWDKGLDWYLDHFRNAGIGQLKGEFSSTYLRTPESAERIKETLGDVKIIISIRNPVERFLSHYKFYLRMGELDADFRMLNMRNFKKAAERFPEFLENGLYYRNIQRFLEFFDRDQIHIIVKEDIDSDPAQELSRLYGFLSVDPNFLPPIAGKKVSPGIVPRIAFLERARSVIVGKINSISPRMVVLGRKTRVAELYRRLNASREGSGFAVEDNVALWLADYYREDQDKCQGLLV